MAVSDDDSAIHIVPLSWTGIIIIVVVIIVFMCILHYIRECSTPPPIILNISTGEQFNIAYP